MTSWRNLEAELDTWAGGGKVARFWWRDDDAVAPSPALGRLLALAAAHDAPLALAVIPALGAPALGELLSHHALATPVQHGFAHENHAPPDEKKTELGAHRSYDLVVEDLRRGRSVMASLFGSGFLSMLVPPWNRIAAELVDALPGLGMTALSTYGPRPKAEPVPGLLQVNTHVDIMRWMEPRGFLGEEAALALICGHLEARRRRAGPDALPDPTEPTGILTHHLVHDEAAWAFVARLLRLLGHHPAASILGPREALEPAGAMP